MRTGEKGVQKAPIKESPDLEGSSRPRRPLSTPVKVALLVAAALIVGLVGRGLVASGVSNTFLADLLPWLQGTPVTVYFPAGDGVHLVPLSRTLTGENDSLDGLTAALLEGPPANSGMIQLLPDAARVNSTTLEASTLTVDMSAEYTSRGSPLADEALIQTFGSWPEVKAVSVTVEGAPLETTPSTGHLLFFYDPLADLLVAEQTNANSARDVLNEYLAGPGGAGLVGLPSDVEVLDFHAAPGSGLLQLNMTYSASVRAMALEDSDAMRRILEGLMTTLTTGFADIQFLYLDFEGHAQLGLGQCADLLRRAQPPPRILNDERLLFEGER